MKFSISDEATPAFVDVKSFPDKYLTRFRFFKTAQTMQKNICTSKFEWLKRIYCHGTNETLWRSNTTGTRNWQLIAEPETQTLVTYKPASRENLIGRFIHYAKETLDHLNLQNSCPILYIVNAPTSSPQLMEKHGR